MTTTCTVTVPFTGAHRLVGVDIPCQALHGHFYAVSFTFTACPPSNSPPPAGGMTGGGGMVIEFDSARKKIADWFAQNWDHNIILHESDKELGEGIAKITKQKICYLPFNPTAENLGEYLIHKICPMLFEGSGAVCTKIHLQETPEYSATVEI